jgi:two-component system nitrate/nitrite response regulator NarL
LKHVLRETRFRVCFECSDLGDVPETAIRDSQPSIILIGIGAAAEQDLSRIETLKRTHDHLLIVVLADGTGLESFLTAMDAGADSYVEKDYVPTATLVLALDLALSREAIVPLALMRVLKDRVRERPVAESVIDVNGKTDLSEHTAGQLAPDVLSYSDIGLSKRERMILWHLTQGAPNKQIARELLVAEATVKVHVKALLRKIRAKNRTQAAMWAIGNGFTCEQGIERCFPTSTERAPATNGDECASLPASCKVEATVPPTSLAGR